MKLEIQLLETLAAIIEEGSFDKAAQRLAVTQSAVSQRLRQLETRLGKVLVRRTTPARPTADGRQLMKYYRQIAHLQAELLQQFALQRDKPEVVAIGVNADSLATWLLEALSELLEPHDWRLEVQVDDQDRTHELLHNGEVIGCISSSKTPVSGCNCFHLGTMTYRALVSPEFYQRYFAKGVTPDTIRLAPCVQYNRKDDLQKRYLETYFEQKTFSPVHRIPSTESFLDFIVRGFAWGMVPDIQSLEWQRKGIVQELKPGCTLEVDLYWHIWDLRSQFSQQLTDAIIRHAQKVLN